MSNDRRKNEAAAATERKCKYLRQVSDLKGTQKGEGKSCVNKEKALRKRRELVENVMIPFEA